MTDEARQRKATLRAAVLAARDGLSDSQLAAAGDAVAEHGMAAWLGARTIAAYLSIGPEPSTQTLIDRLVASGTRVLLPIIDAADLGWAAYSGRSDLTSGPLGITEPTGPRLSTDALADAAAVIVPALAADRAGNRLGRGRGYYDRALATVSAPVIAVVYDEELLDEVPTEPHDRRVDAILTPSGLTYR